MSSSFTPSPAELALVNQIFLQADHQKLGILTGDAAIKIFTRAKLSPTALGEIWGIADEDNNGWLSKKGTSIAVRLMGWAQNGEKISPALVNKPGPLPAIEGFSLPAAQHATGISLSKSPPPGLPPLTPQDKAKFQRLFIGCGPVNGLLSGDKARDVFVKSKLPVEKLVQIWNLADTQDRGALDATDFAVGMYLIQALMSGQLTFVPTSLPPGLYEQAAGVSSHTSGSSASGAFPPPPSSKVQLQFTGQSNQILRPDTTGSTRASRLPANLLNTGNARSSPFGTVQTHVQHKWDVTPTEKANSDRFFDTLDSQKKGYIEGDVAVPFMLDSKLDGETLAQVWDLADINNDGKLTRDGFAIAMHLIQGKLAGRDLPASLPPSLVPPIRSPVSTSFANGPPFPPPEPTKDLIWDDSPPASATAFTSAKSALQTQSTGTAFTPQTKSPPKQPAAGLDPFASSGFGVFDQTTVSTHLLDDDDTGTPSIPLHDQSAEIGNVSNQLNSTNRSLSATTSEVATNQQNLISQAAQLSALQTQLSSAKAAYETETKLLATLRERHSAQNAEIQKAKQELIRAESDLSAVRVSKAEIEGTFLRDKEEARDLHRKMMEVGAQVEQLKADVEKVKKEAKQQKGLLAIARKQLSAKEADKVKATTELDAANAELAEVTKDKEATEAELAKETPPVKAPNLSNTLQRATSIDSLTIAASHTLPISPELSGSPAPNPSAGRSNNPFERLQFAESSGSRSSSPFQQFKDTSIPASPNLGVKEVRMPEISDPFGFSQPVEAEELAPPSMPSGENIETPRPSPLNVELSSAAPEPNKSSGSTTASEEHFSTPTALVPSESSPAEKEVTNLAPGDSSIAKFPQVENVSNVSDRLPASGAQSNDQDHTDLGSQLKELDANESDSDSEEDERPLAELVGKPAPGPTANGVSLTASPAFDDVFGTTTDVEPTKPPSPTPAVNILSLAPPPPTLPAEPPAGVDAFDEAMGRISPSGIAPTPAFLADSTFDDDFDFASAKENDTSAFPHVPKTVNGKSPIASGLESAMPTSDPNGAPAITVAAEQKPLTFDDAFGSVLAPDQPSVAPAPPDEPHHGIMFDEAFSGDPATALQLNNPTTSPTSSQFAIEPKPFPPSSPPTTNKPDSPVSGTRAGSPPPSAGSPTPHVSSPTRARPSTSSSKDSDKLKEPSTRHSKLSIRLPFRKKKQDSHPPPQPQVPALSPLAEPTGNTFADDDVEAVKQLQSMGFTRAQAVEALEKHGYNMSRALNTLLGQ